MGIIFSFCPYKTHISYTFCRQPYAARITATITPIYLIIINFIGSSYMSELFVKNVTHIEHYMGSVMGVLCVFFLECSVCVHMCV